ncbi:hypothetical protein Bbelb_292380 [Branchiostoma belcheri]|nr:hypothetical protein Bbelb_292380 [Branchiostoma belcheri]
MCNGPYVNWTVRNNGKYMKEISKMTFNLLEVGSPCPPGRFPDKRVEEEGPPSPRPEQTLRKAVADLERQIAKKLAQGETFKAREDRRGGLSLFTQCRTDLIKLFTEKVRSKPSPLRLIHRVRVCFKCRLMGSAVHEGKFAVTTEDIAGIQTGGDNKIQQSSPELGCNINSVSFSTNDSSRHADMRTENSKPMRSCSDSSSNLDSCKRQDSYQAVRTELSLSLGGSQGRRIPGKVEGGSEGKCPVPKPRRIPGKVEGSSKGKCPVPKPRRIPGKVEGSSEGKRPVPKPRRIPGKVEGGCAGPSNARGTVMSRREWKKTRDRRLHQFKVAQGKGEVGGGIGCQEDDRGWGICKDREGKESRAVSGAGGRGQTRCRKKALKIKGVDIIDGDQMPLHRNDTAGQKTLTMKDCPTYVKLHPV